MAGKHIRALTCALLFAVMFSIASVAGAVDIVDPSTLITGDFIYIGHYPQTQITDLTNLVEGVDYVSLLVGTATRYYRIEPIRWRVLENDQSDDELFLMSQMGLDYKRWNDTMPVVPRSDRWVDSTIRVWLGETFLTRAFTGAEQEAIKTTLVTTPDFPYSTYVYRGSPDTYDKVFLLSLNEITNTAFGFAATLPVSNPARVANITAYALATQNFPANYSPDYWWLRHAGNSANNANRVDYNGNAGGQSVYNAIWSVRPALNLDLDAVYFTPRAGGGYDANLKGTVTFDPNNGDSTFTEKVIPGTEATRPADPVRAGFVFNGWWTDPTAGDLWNFEDPVNEDMTLYAHWLEIFTVTFFPENNQAPWDVSVTQGSPVAEPVPAPTYPGYRFDGWWTSPLTGTLWSFDTPVQGNMELYARYRELFSVLYLPGTTDPVTNMPVDQVATYAAFDTVIVSALQPVRPGYTFEGWTVSGIDATLIDPTTGEFVMPPNDVVFTAVWKAVPGGGGLPTAGDNAPVLAMMLLAIVGASVFSGAHRRRVSR